MEKWEMASELLEERLKDCEFQDEVYTMVDDIIRTNISSIEKELGMTDDDFGGDDVTWYDELMEDMRSILYKRIGKWLNS